MTIFRGAQFMRLSILAVVAIVGLGQFCGGAQAGRMWLPKAENPYCDVTTYRARELPEQAMSMLDSNGKPVIVVSGIALVEKPSYGQFLMAHECCHHSLGHVRRYQEGLGHVGPQPFFFIAPALKQMELDADCCAVKMLRRDRRPDSIVSARDAMVKFGAAPTGAHYPTGIERVDNIEKCAAEE
ncbi:MAG TPA: hypothetical protein VEW64_09310 [Methyloceanibacter sp.]|nr:hypothetical protein [Methyloceanibacter sp.]